MFDHFIKTVRLACVLALLCLFNPGLMVGVSEGFVPPKPPPKRPKLPPKKPPGSLQKRPPMPSRKQPPRQSVVAHPSTKAKTAKSRSFSSFSPKSLRTRVNQWRENRFKAKQRRVSVIEPQIKKLNDHLKAYSAKREKAARVHSNIGRNIDDISHAQKSVKLASKASKLELAKRKQIGAQIKAERKLAAIDKDTASMRKALKSYQKELDGLQASINRSKFYTDPSEGTPNAAQVDLVRTRGSISERGTELNSRSSIRQRYEQGPTSDGPASRSSFDSNVGAENSQRSSRSLIETRLSSSSDTGNQVSGADASSPSRSSEMIRTSSRSPISTFGNPFAPVEASAM